MDRRHWALNVGNGAVCVSHTAGNYRLSCHQTQFQAPVSVSFPLRARVSHFSSPQHTQLAVHVIVCKSELAANAVLPAACGVR